MTKPKPEEQQNAFDPKNEAEPGATCYLINEETQEEERILFEDLRPGQLVRFVFRETEKQEAWEVVRRIVAIPFRTWTGEGQWTWGVEASEVEPPGTRLSLSGYVVKDT